MAQEADPKEPAGLTGIAKAALICNCSRDVIRKKISAANLMPAGETTRGDPLYRILDVCRAYLGVDGASKEGKAPDPERMTGSERNAWYQAEDRKLNLMQRKAELVPVELWRREADAMCRELAQYLETLPDVLERDANLDPQTVELLNESVRRYRQKMADEMIARRTPAQRAIA